MANNDLDKPKNPRGRQRGGTALQTSNSTTSQVIRAIRVQEMIEMRARGVSVPDVAKAFNTSTASVYRHLKWAETEGLLGELKEQVTRRLGKLSIDVYENAMKADVNTTTPEAVEVHRMKLTAAKDVSHGIGILQKKVETHTVQETHSMEWYYENRNKSEQADGAEESAGYHAVLDGQIVAEEDSERLESGADQAFLPTGDYLGDDREGSEGVGDEGDGSGGDPE